MGMFGSGSKHQRDGDSTDVREAALRDIFKELLKEHSNDTQKQHAELLTALSAEHANLKAELLAQLTDMNQRFEDKLAAQQQAFSEQLSARDKAIDALKSEVASLKQQCAGATEEADARAARRANLVINGIPESVAASALMPFISKQCAQILGDRFSQRDVLDAYRLGRRPAAARASSSTSRPRPVLVKFASVSVRDAAMRNKRSFIAEGGKKLFLDPDLTPAEQKQKRALGATYHALKQHKMRPFWRNAVLFFYPDPNGQRFEQHPANFDAEKRLSPEDVPVDATMGDAPASRSA
jgi:hypothetical protein